MPQADFEPTWALLARPAGYPTGPSVGKPELILNTNSTELYHKFSPYSNFSQNGGLLNWGDQPFYYVYVDQAKTFPNARAGQSQVFPLQDSIIDVQRVTKFLASGNGVTFLATQLLLQTGNAFDETRIYNPTSPIVAAGMGLTFNAVRPERFLDISSLSGLATSLLGGAGTLLAGGSTVTPPASTTGRGALPQQNQATDGKGLLRGGDANKGLANFKSKWSPSQGGTNSFMSAVAGLASSLFSNFIPARQSGITYRSDEGSYGIMLAAASPRFDYSGNDGGTFPFGQLWIGGGKGIRKQGEYPNSPSRLFVKVQNGKVVPILISTAGGLTGDISSVGSVGYDVNQSTNILKPGYRYGDATNQNNSFNQAYNGSDIMYQYQYYVDDTQAFPTKDPETQVSEGADTLGGIAGTIQKNLNNILAASGKTYSTVTPDGTILRNSTISYNYDRLFQTKDKLDTPSSYPNGAQAAYRNSGVRMVSNDIASSPANSLKLPTAFQADTINTLNVLDSSAKGTTWNPFSDDLVALYFYDVVNDKYIPFRAIISGIGENGNASWDEMPFIGRADKVYSYGGFSRNLNFTINIVINSISELAPTWQRINYMMTSYKPANYTRRASATGGDLVYDRFMVPPMFMFTLGDVYRDQPILIQSVAMTIPEGAAWETYNQENQGNTWAYMANTIKAAAGTKFGQVPREIQLAFTAILLEKERAVVGGANFGHAPRTEDFNNFNYDTALPESFNAWNVNYVVNIPNLVTSTAAKDLSNGYGTPSGPAAINQAITQF